MYESGQNENPPHLRLCQLSPAAVAGLLDHLVGGHEQLVRHSEAEHPGGLGVDHQLELGRLHNRQIGGLGAFEDAASIDAGLTPCLSAKMDFSTAGGFNLPTWRRAMQFP